MPPSSPVNQGHRAATTADLVDDVAAATVPSGWSNAEGIVSSLRKQEDVGALCAKHGVSREFTARLAGNLRACSTPPQGYVCVYAHALEGGMRFPLHAFFTEVLVHFGLAPTQLAPNCWRIMAGFLVLCDVVGVLPSLRIFRHFFFLCVLNHKHRGWYFFKSRDVSSGLRFSGLPYMKDWKHAFFFLSSSAPWPCPVEWGEPSESSFEKPVLTSEEDIWAGKLRRASRAATIDPTTYILRDGKLAAAMRVSVSPSPPTPTVTPSSARTTDRSIEMDPVVYGMMKTMLAEKAAAQDSASAKKGKTVPASEATESSVLCGRRRSLSEANGEEAPSVVENSPAGAHGCSMPMPKVANNTTSPFGYALDVEKRLLARELDAAALWKQLAAVKAELAASKRAEAEREKVNVELAAAKRTGEEELDKVKAELAAVNEVAKAERQSADAKMAAVQQLLRSEERVLQRAEPALEGYKRWKGSASTAPRT